MGFNMCLSRYFIDAHSLFSLQAHESWVIELHHQKNCPTIIGKHVNLPHWQICISVFFPITQLECQGLICQQYFPKLHYIMVIGWTQLMVIESSVARLGPPNDHYLILNTSSTYFIEHRRLMRQVHCHQPQCITNFTFTIQHHLSH